MKINDLEPGMLLRPVDGRKPAISPLNAESPLDCDPLELVMISDEEGTENFIMMYLGCKHQNFLIDGVNKHHIISTRGKTVLTTGYQFRYLIPDNAHSL
jgi:hypothetical protein